MAQHIDPELNMDVLHPSPEKMFVADPASLDEERVDRVRQAFMASSPFARSVWLQTVELVKNGAIKREDLPVNISGWPLNAEEAMDIALGNNERVLAVARNAASIDSVDTNEDGCFRVTFGMRMVRGGEVPFQFETLIGKPLEDGECFYKRIVDMLMEWEKVSDRSVFALLVGEDSPLKDLEKRVIWTRDWNIPQKMSYMMNEKFDGDFEHYPFRIVLSDELSDLINAHFDAERAAFVSAAELWKHEIETGEESEETLNMLHEVHDNAPKMPWTHAGAAIRLTGKIDGPNEKTQDGDFRFYVSVPKLEIGFVFQYSDVKKLREKHAKNRSIGATVFCLVQTKIHEYCRRHNMGTMPWIHALLAGSEPLADYSELALRTWIYNGNVTADICREEYEDILSRGVRRLSVVTTQRALEAAQTRDRDIKMWQMRLKKLEEEKRELHESQMKHDVEEGEEVEEEQE